MMMRLIEGLGFKDDYKMSMKIKRVSVLDLLEPLVEVEVCGVERIGETIKVVAIPQRRKQHPGE